MATNVKLNVKYGEKDSLSTIANTNGTLYVATKGDNKAELHVDLNGTRYLISDALTADAELSANSENAVQNKVINSEINDIYTSIANKAPKENGIYYIEGTGSTAGTWLGSDNRFTDLYKGLTIAYKIPIAGGSSTTTLNINGKGEKIVYMNASSKVTTHYPVGTVVILIYDGSSWKVADYNSDTDTKVKVYKKTTDADYPLIASSTATTSITTTGVAVEGLIPSENIPTVNPSNGLVKLKGLIVTDTITGKIQSAGTADSATEANHAATAEIANKLNSNAGSSTKPIYFANGVPVACGSSLGVSVTGKAASADKLNTNAGSSTKPVYFANGIPVLCEDTLNVNISGNADTSNVSGEAAKLGCGNVGSAEIPVHFIGGQPVVCGSELSVDISGNAATADKADALNVSAAIGNASSPIYIDANGNPNVADEIISDVATLKSDLEALEGSFNNDVAALSAHTKNSTIHVTETDKTKWNGYDAGKSDTGHTHNVTHTPGGTVISTFTGKAVNSSAPIETDTTVASSTHTHKYTPAGTISAPTFTGTAGTASASYTPAGTVSQPTFTGTKATISTKYTPSGTVSKPTFTGTEVTTGTGSSTNIYSITGVGSLPNHTYTAPSLTASVSNKCLTLSFSTGSHSFSAGSLPTRSDAISVAIGDHTHKVTAAGTISQPTFGGIEATISAEYTPVGTVSKPTFTGTNATISSSYTPKGSISAPTFTGTEGVTTSITGTVDVASSGHKHSVTASGTVGSTFSGTAATLTTTKDQ